MTELLEKQFDFQYKIALLKLYAYSKGYRFSGGDAYRSKRVFGEWGEKKGYGSAKSVHKLRLAEDLNLFVLRDERYKLADTGQEPEWVDLHDYWESIGGSKRIENDMNHFSFEYRGCR